MPMAPADAMTHGIEQEEKSMGRSLLCVSFLMGCLVYAQGQEAPKIQLSYSESKHFQEKTTVALKSALLIKNIVTDAHGDGEVNVTVLLSNVEQSCKGTDPQAMSGRRYKVTFGLPYANGEVVLPQTDEEFVLDYTRHAFFVKKDGPEPTFLYRALFTDDLVKQRGPFASMWFTGDGKDLAKRTGSDKSFLTSYDAIKLADPRYGYGTFALYTEVQVGPPKDKPAEGWELLPSTIHWFRMGDPMLRSFLQISAKKGYRGEYDSTGDYLILLHTEQGIRALFESHDKKFYAHGNVPLTVCGPFKEDARGHWVGVHNTERFPKKSPLGQ